jgi:hypothetical protein
MMNSVVAARYARGFFVGRFRTMMKVTPDGSPIFPLTY